MAKVTTDYVFDVPIDVAYSVITDYESYPKFVTGSSSVSIVERGDHHALVEYSINVIKTFKYILKMIEQKPNRVSWSFEKGDLFSKNEGSWELKAVNDKQTEAKYTLDLDFKIKVPKMILGKLVNSNFPKMMEEYHQRMKAV